METATAELYFVSWKFVVSWSALQNVGASTISFQIDIEVTEVVPKGQSSRAHKGLVVVILSCSGSFSYDKYFLFKTSHRVHLWGRTFEMELAKFALVF